MTSFPSGLIVAQPVVQLSKTWPDITIEDAYAISSEVTRRKVAAYDWESELGLQIPVTISVGIASAARGDDRELLGDLGDGESHQAAAPTSSPIAL